MSSKKSCALPKSFFPLKFKATSSSHALRLAKKLIGKKQHWVQDNFAVTLDADESIEVDDPRAQAFCALGALQRVNTKFQRRAEAFLALAAYNMETEVGQPLEGVASKEREARITEYNDDTYRVHEQVLEMFDKAIKFAKFWERTGKVPKVA